MGFIEYLPDSLRERFQKKDYGEVVTRIEEPIPLEELLSGGPCEGCQEPMEKAYISWTFPSDIDEHDFKVTVEQVPGYKCAHGGTSVSPSWLGLVQAIDQAVPVFQERKFKRSVENLKWTRNEILEVVIPYQDKINKLISGS